MVSHILVIAEKPSVARSIAGVIDANKKQDGYFEGNGYMMTCRFCRRNGSTSFPPRRKSSLKSYVP